MPNLHGVSSSTWEAWQILGNMIIGVDNTPSFEGDAEKIIGGYYSEQ